MSSEITLSRTPSLPLLLSGHSHLQNFSRASNSHLSSELNLDSKSSTRSINARRYSFDKQEKYDQSTKNYWKNNFRSMEDEITTIVLQDQGLIVQPKFFEHKGTMCSAELWSNSIKKQFLNFTKQDILANSNGQRSFQLKKYISDSCSRLEVGVNKVYLPDRKRNQVDHLKAIIELKQGVPIQRQSIVLQKNRYSSSRQNCENEIHPLFQTKSRILDQSIENIQSKQRRNSQNKQQVNNTPSYKKENIQGKNSPRQSLNKPIMMVPSLDIFEENNKSLSQKQTKEKENYINLEKGSSGQIEGIRSSYRKGTSLQTKLSRQLTQEKYRHSLKSLPSQATQQEGELNSTQEQPRDEMEINSLHEIPEFNEEPEIQNKKTSCEDIQVDSEREKNNTYADAIKGIIDICNETLENENRLIEKQQQGKIKQKKDKYLRLSLLQNYK